MGHPELGPHGALDRLGGGRQVEQPVRRRAADPELRQRVRRPAVVAQRGPDPGLVGGADPAGQDQDGGPDVLDRRAQLLGQLPGPRLVGGAGLLLVLVHAEMVPRGGRLAPLAGGDGPVRALFRVIGLGAGAPAGSIGA
ncbi:hypothetical protein P3T34_000075 [Kitasatospora sp. MAP12-44]|uniref:hypothetical protein n=1 Tax=Kitasatospora sp. MAP12-44 TaxID=3035099 RepID=UPI002476340F|nr:hypothetical protein [Kitasatospora sp. MAP12-44]MDH6107860.1 hypothetical protein [Kitasatospora sp. MAP12-44]